MSAIAGLVVMPPLQAAPRAANAMLEVIHAPASPRIDAWQNGSVGIGAKSAKRASARHIDDRYVVVADARLDNRRGLCGALNLREAHTSDSALIAAAYRAWGMPSLDHLRGDFAFALWDRQENSLFCARDRFGVKPLYYRRTDKGLRFASEIKALAADDGLQSLALDEDWVVDFAAGFVTDTVSTPYAEVRRLPPAHFIRWTHGEMSIVRYWTLDNVCEAPEVREIEALRAAFIDAVDRRMAGGNTAAFLSGGLDSSSICCVARDLRSTRLQPPLNTISMVFDATPKESERAHIEAVLATGHFSAQLINIANYRPLHALGSLIELQDGPFLAPGLPLSERAYAVAASSGFDTVLDGHGGDEVISSGLGRLHELARAGAWGQLFSAFVALGVRERINTLPAFVSYVAHHDRGPMARVSRSILARTRRTPPSTHTREWLAPEWIEDEQAKVRHQQQQRFDPKFFQSDRDYHAAMLSGPLQPYGFEVLSNISRSYGLESQFPFWDQQVVELCLRFPSSAKLSNGFSRSLIRSAMKGIIPEATRRRTDKLDFGSHLIRGLLQDKSMLFDVANSENTALERFVDRAAFGEALNQIQNPAGRARGKAAWRVWQGVSLAVWLSSRRASSSHAKAPLECQI